MSRPSRFRTAVPVALGAAAIFAVGAGAGVGVNALITGKDVKDSSLTGWDVRDGSIGMRDLAGTTREQLQAKGEQGARGERGARGEQGARGDQGARGEQGARGDQGPRGEAGPNGISGGSVTIGTIPGPVTVVAGRQRYGIPGGHSFTWTTPAGSADAVEVVATMTPSNPNSAACLGQEGDLRIGVGMTRDGLVIDPWAPLWGLPGDNTYYGSMGVVGPGSHTVSAFQTVGLECEQVVTDIFIKARRI